jgi:hypothetical protein
VSDQYIRKVGLFVTNSQGQGLDLSNMEIIFRVSTADVATPNVANIRVLNLSDATSKTIKSEFQNVRLQAGYEGGSYGTIFSGQIARFRSGRLDAKDKFLQIEAGDGDKAFQFALVSKTLAAGASQQDKMNAVAEALAKYDVTYDAKGNPVPSTGGVLPRGKVLFGLAKDQMRPIVNTGEATWSIQNGQVVVIPLTGYASGEAVVLNSGTGLIDVPEATENGVEAQCLLNPRIKIGTRVQIDQALINQTQINQQGFPRYTDINFVASVAQDGFYRVLVSEHEGDVRGGPWNTDLICLAVNQSSPQDSSVLPYGVAPNAGS